MHSRARRSPGFQNGSLGLVGSAPVTAGRVKANAGQNQNVGQAGQVGTSVVRRVWVPVQTAAPNPNVQGGNRNTNRRRRRRRAGAQPQIRSVATLDSVAQISTAPCYRTLTTVGIIKDNLARMYDRFFARRTIQRPHVCLGPEFRNLVVRPSSDVPNSHQKLADARRTLERMAVVEILKEPLPFINVGAMNGANRIGDIGRQFIAVSPVLDGADANRRQCNNPRAVVCQDKLKDCPGFLDFPCQYLFTHSIYYMDERDLDRMATGSSGFIVMHEFDGDHGSFVEPPEAYWTKNGSLVTMKMANGVGTVYTHEPCEWVFAGGRHLNGKTIATYHIRELDDTHLFRFKVMHGKIPLVPSEKQVDRSDMYREIFSSLVAVQNKTNVVAWSNAINRVTSQAIRKSKDYTLEFITREARRAAQAAHVYESEVIGSLDAGLSSDNQHNAVLKQMAVDNQCPALSPFSKGLLAITAASGVVLLALKSAKHGSVSNIKVPYTGPFFLGSIGALMALNYRRVSVYRRWLFRSSV